MLTISSISHTYTRRKSEAVRALDDVSLSAAPGCITAVVGPNGSGKSTLFRVVTGAMKADEGSVQFDSRAVKKSELGVVFQSPSLDPMLTVFENLSHHSMLHGRRLRRTDLPGDVITVLGIGDELDARVEQLSGGFQRRVELAKALLSNPAILVMDEPFAGLDVRARGQFFALVRKLAAERGLTVLLITHELELATQCDRVVVLRTGKVFADSTPAELLEPFGDAVVEIQTVDSGMVEARLRTAGFTVLRLHDDTLFLPRAELRSVVDALGEGARGASIESRRPTLDDWFIAQTGEHLVDHPEAMAA